MKPTARALLCVCLLAFAAAGCDEKLSDVAGPTPDLQPTFSSIQRDILSANDSTGRPACTSCHNATGARFAGNLSLVGSSAYDNLVNAASTGKPGAVRVVPGAPDASYLLNKLLGANIAGVRMPRLGPYLSDGQIRIIRRWIELGAKND